MLTYENQEPVEGSGGLAPRPDHLVQGRARPPVTGSTDGRPT